jgi:serine phosphatase RsbU (regulator of sigma subunit)
MRTTLLFLLLLFLAPTSWSQDELVISEKTNFFNNSVSDQLMIYEVDLNFSIQDFINRHERIVPRKMRYRFENLDFTTSTFFIEFSIENKATRDYSLVLETARPITNEVSLYCVNDSSIVHSGDGISYSEKSIQTSTSALPLLIPAGKSRAYILKLSSDGETLTLPMIFREVKNYNQLYAARKMNSGLYFGVFLFALFIYMTFYILLKEKLFLLYVGYVLFSGLLQFALHGYVHEYFATSGGYWTQHSILLIAGCTMLFAVLYARNYLELTGKLKLIANVLIGLAILATGISLIPGTAYEMAYPIINGLSFLALVYLLIAGIIRQKSGEVSKLFILGLGFLVLGGIVFILGNFGVIDAPAITQRSLTVGTLLELLCLSILMVRRFKSLQEEKALAQKMLLDELSEANVRLERDVAERTEEIETQRVQLKEKNEDFVASVKYAERIQSAVLSNESKFKSIIPQSFVMFRPKDIVSGDFYWVETIPPTTKWPKGLIVYATADCTGHGVPGSLVSMIGNNVLQAGKRDVAVQTPGDMLDFLNVEISAILNSEFVVGNIRDGMDIALCAIDLEKNELYFSGAQNSAYIIRKGELIELKGDRKSIGFVEGEEVHHFTNQVFALESGDIIYTCSDGYADQFGGPKDKKFMSKRLKILLIEIAVLPLIDQQKRVEKEFDEWIGDQEQVDDVLLIGVYIS